MQAAKKLMLGAAIALAGAAALGSHNANARVAIYANIEPPAAVVETVPGPRPGYVWVGGYYGWAHGKYNWHKGYWQRERRGYHWAPARWDRDGNRWRYYGGHWER